MPLVVKPLEMGVEVGLLWGRGWREAEGGVACRRGELEGECPLARVGGWWCPLVALAGRGLRSWVPLAMLWSVSKCRRLGSGGPQSAMPESSPSGSTSRTMAPAHRLSPAPHLRRIAPLPAPLLGLGGSRPANQRLHWDAGMRDGAGCPGANLRRGAAWKRGGGGGEIEAERGWESRS